MMFEFGPTKILHFDAGIYSLGHGYAETEVTTMKINGKEYQGRAIIEVNLQPDLLKAVTDPYEETRLQLAGSIRITIEDTMKAFRFEGEASGKAGFIVVRAAELGSLEIEGPIVLQGSGIFSGMRVAGEFSGRLSGFDPAGYPEFEVAFVA